jgi:hypothetical protein
MRRRRVIQSLLICAVVAVGARVEAAVDWEIARTVKLEAEPNDVVVSPDGRRTFVLTAAGDVLIYSAQGVLEEQIHVGTGFDTIASSTAGDRLVLSSRSRSAIQFVALDFVREINTVGAPYKGPADAPVTVAVFSDFQ